MNRSAIGISILAAAALAASVGLPGATVDARRSDHRLQFYKAKAEAYEAAYNELLSGLERVEKLNDRRGRRTARRIHRVIHRTRQRAAAFVEDTQHDHGRYTNYDRDTAVVVVEPVTDQRATWYETVQPMSPRDFRALRRSVDDASFSSEKIRIVEAVAEHNWFTVDQVVNLVKVASFADTQVEIAAMLYPRVVELNDWYKVYEALDFESSRKKLRKRVRALQRNH